MMLSRIQMTIQEALGKQHHYTLGTFILKAFMKLSRHLGARYFRLQELIGAILEIPMIEWLQTIEFGGVKMDEASRRLNAFFLK